MGIPLDGYEDQGVEGYDTCEGEFVDVTSDFDNSWSTANHSIATVNAYGVHTGVAIGSTTTNASADEQIFNERQDCPIEPVSPSGPDNVNPTVDFQPPITTVGVGQTATTTAEVSGNSDNYQISVSISGGAKIIAPTGTFTSSTPVVVQGVTAGSATLTATVNVPDGGGTETISNPNDVFTITVPSYMIVESDVLGKCTECNTTVERFVAYQVTNSDGSPAPYISIGESVSNPSNWSCSQAQQYPDTSPCGGPSKTDGSGQFVDGWTMNSDAYTPVGCGHDTTDEWAACPSTNVGHLVGYVHTNAIEINGVVNPPNQFPAGTKINP